MPGAVLVRRHELEKHVKCQLTGRQRPEDAPRPALAVSERDPGTGQQGGDHGGRPRIG
ncbi:hypothetical protein GCM10011581_19700 [Saccharopolyspora subtropica]|uniref:Uncharacterized protein n=1 Tax=Saccharopolyspora thermophila TaxID=89367 RepID=A0A917JUN7_9PSEU|nr:hypothetical protein GCM10011581_19700 [Saccharopolyspora subtropica]